MSWRIDFYSEAIYDEFHSLTEDIIGSFIRIGRLIERVGPQNVHEPYIKHLEGKLWEMRLHGKDGIARVVYVTAYEKRVVIVHVFKKKTQKTPRREIEIAKKRAKEIR